MDERIHANVKITDETTYIILLHKVMDPWYEREPIIRVAKDFK